MNINQLARNQQMMYNFIRRDSSYVAQIQAQFSSFDALKGSKTGGALDADSLLQQMGMGGLEGRTVREMAKYKMEVQQKSQASQSSDGSLSVGASAQQFPIRALYTPISDEATAAMQELALQDAVNSVGKVSPDSRERVSLIQEQLQSVAPSKRAAAFNTMNKVWESEIDRIGGFIKEQDPSWGGWGDQFDTTILDNYKPGINIWA